MNPIVPYLRVLLIALLLGAVWPCAIVAIAAAEEPAKPSAKPASSVDEDLLNDLDNELLDGAGDLKKTPAKRPADPQAPGEETPLEQPEDEDIGMPSPEQDPLGYIGEEMRRVERMMVKRNQQPHAEQVQRQIVENLAKLIEQAEQQRSKQSAGSKSKQQSQPSQRQQVQQPKESQSGKPGEQQSSQPASDSTDRLGKNKTVAADPALVKGLLKDAWGHLPERQREQMLQNSPERFLPQYELMIERYYRRLAEEQRGK